MTPYNNCSLFKTQIKLFYQQYEFQLLTLNSLPLFAPLKEFRNQFFFEVNLIPTL
jgi:hypothetical protein